MSKQMTWLVCTLCPAALYTFVALVPFSAFPLFLFFSAPTLLLTIAQGVRRGLGSVLAVAALITALVGPFHGFTFLITYALPGLMTAYFIHKHGGRAESVALAILTSLLCKLSVTFAAARVLGTNLLMTTGPEGEKLLREMFPNSPAMLERLTEALEYAALLAPSIMILMAAAEVASSCFIAAHLYKRGTGKNLFDLPPFTEWRFPSNVILALLVAFICEMLGARNEDAYLYKMIGLNLGLVVRTIFIIQGVSLIVCLIERRGYPRSSRIIVFAFATLIAMGREICSIIGLIDIGFDLRNRLGRKR